MTHKLPPKGSNLCGVCGKPCGKPVKNAHVYHMECLREKFNRLGLRNPKGNS